VAVVVSVALLVAATSPPAPAHEPSVSTAAGHLEEDAVAPLDHATAQRFERRTLAATPDRFTAAAAGPPPDPGQLGSWGPVVDWPVVGIHVALLETGKVLAYDSVGDLPTESYDVHDHTRATVWDPATGSQTPVDLSGFNIFCSGLAHLVDGSVFVAGGNKNAQLEGIVQTHFFDSDTNAWSRGPDMAAGRWYPSVTPLSNGESLITSGGPPVPEVLQTDRSLRALTDASLSLPLYPWIDVGPDGRAFYSGPDQSLRSLDTSGTGSWQGFGQRDSLNRDYGSHAMFDIGKILVAGGGPSSKDARVIDLNGPTPQVAATDPMNFGRRQHNLTVLADGTVLATGGNSSGAQLVDLNAGVYPAELWNPATGHWRQLAAMQVTRQYHSTALLLPDGRVLSAGGGICGTCNSVGYLAKNAEVFSPPYLFKSDGSGQLATRPTISSAPGDVDYNSAFSISTPDAGSISKVALVRLGAVTHSVNMEQRYVPLSFTAAGGTINATAPANANIAPPGPYMLFLIDGAGVPSVAKMVNVRTAAPPTVSSVSPAADASAVARTTKVTAAFDRAMNKSSVEAAFSLTRNSDGATVPGSFSWNGNEVSFTPAVPLDGGTGYTASVGSGARDSAGTGIESAKTWQFTTATQPVVQVAVPGENATEVLPNASLVVIFDTAMDKPAAEGAFSLKRTANGKPIGGTFGWFGNALIFKPNYSLVGGAQYTVSLSTAARDVAGNPLPAAMTWRFTTTSRPIVESVYPVAGATGVARGSVTIAAFNKSMDKRSAESAFSLKRTSGGASVAGSLAWYGNSLIFTPSTPLAANTRYTAAIAGTAKDLAGKTVANPTTWKYTTGN
jgi:hypothetical protein